MGRAPEEGEDEEEVGSRGKAQSLTRDGGSLKLVPRPLSAGPELGPSQHLVRDSHPSLEHPLPWRPWGCKQVDDSLVFQLLINASYGLKKKKSAEKTQ